MSIFATHISAIADQLPVTDVALPAASAAAADVAPLDPAVAPLAASAADVAPLDPATLTTELVAIIEPIGFFGATATDLELMPPEAMAGMDAPKIEAMRQRWEPRVQIRICDGTVSVSRPQQDVDAAAAEVREFLRCRKDKGKWRDAQHIMRERVKAQKEAGIPRQLRSKGPLSKAQFEKKTDKLEKRRMKVIRLLSRTRKAIKRVKDKEKKALSISASGQRLLPLSFQALASERKPSNRTKPPNCTSGRNTPSKLRRRSSSTN